MLKTKIENLLKKAIRADSRFVSQLSASMVEVFAPENEGHGHYSTNIALRLAKPLKKNPLIIAEEIVKKLRLITHYSLLITRTEIAPPGFINFWLSQEALDGELKKILKLKENYGSLDNWKNKKVMVEFTDPNPFKEFHIGHLYSNIIGEALSKIFEANGAIAKRANYQGDVGLHVAKAIWGMKEKMKSGKMSLAQLEKRNLDYRLRFMGEAYAKGNRALEENPRAKLEITELNKKIFLLDKEIKDLYKKGRKWSLEYFDRIYKRLGTKFDFYYFEREAGKAGFDLVKENIKKSIFIESEGAIVFPGEKYGLHRRVFINSEGLPTYEAKELGLAPQKYKDFPYDLSVIITGNDIVDYFKVLICALKQINPRIGKKTKHFAHGMVRLPSGKMSSRTGDVIRGEDLMNEVKKRVFKIVKSSKEVIAKDREKTAEIVAMGAIKYSLLKASLGSDTIFDFEKSLSLRGDSGPYIQYTYARLKNILRKAGTKPKKIDFQLLETETEKNVIRQLIYFPEVVMRAGERYETNIIADYLFKLANTLNAFYEKEPILKVKKPLRENRLNLIIAATIVLKNGLHLLGIESPERM
ncbi:arginine--tRNA ligase [Candidatus Wolfebacteria bacterium]|nr:arginine--tRNA ligase [Candidatus Wolfebacteria bacterium]